MYNKPTLQRAAHILSLVNPREPVDVILRSELSVRRDLSPTERRNIARSVAAYARWLGWLNPDAPLTQRVETALTLQERFDANPGSVKGHSLAAQAVPGWIMAEIDFPAIPPKKPGALPPVQTAWLRQLQRDPVLWLRAKSAEFAKVSAALAPCTPAAIAEFPQLQDLVSTALSYQGERDLFLTDEFQNGLFEIQDLSSQLVSHACAPQPGQTWWDACAGEGGKSLHLADLMLNKGLIWSTDRSARRLEVLKKRTSRAGVFNYRTANWDAATTDKAPMKTPLDGALIDAPCSGVGTWQRHPHARWSCSATDVRELSAVQTRILEIASKSIKPGGRLVYSVCTITRAETTAIADAFSAAHPEFTPVPVFNHGDWKSPASMILWPHEMNANGMFIATWRRND